MKLNVYSLDGKAAKEKIESPAIFGAEYRPDLIRRAVVASQSHRYQPKGVDWYAGKRTSAESWGVGFARARLPRVKGSGYPTAGMGAIAPIAVGGRTAHPPVPIAKIKKKINSKERRRALASAIAASASKELVGARGHAVEKVPQLPLIVKDDLEVLRTTKEAKDAFVNLGLWEDVERAKERKVRAGKGKMRGRKHKNKKSVLIVVAEDKGISKAARNIPGVDVVSVKDLGVEHLAPGAQAGRLTAYTKSALQQIADKFPAEE